MRNEVKVKRLSLIETPPKGVESKKLSRSQERGLAARKMEENMLWMRQSMEDRLARTFVFDVIGSSNVDRALAREGLGPDADLWRLAPSSTAAIARDLRADVVLKTRVGAYGEISLYYVGLIIFLDLSEAVAEVVVAAEATDNIWVITGVGVSGVLWDVGKWGGGAYVFNKMFLPVILKGRLCSGFDGRALLSRTEISVFTRGKEFRAYPKKQRGLREIRLKTVAWKSIDGLVRSLQSAALKNSAGAPSWRRIPSASR